MKIIRKYIILISIITIVMFMLIACENESEDTKSDEYKKGNNYTVSNDIKELVSEDGYTTIALLGVEDETYAIMLISMNHETKDMKVVSLYQDLLIEDNKGRVNKLCNAYEEENEKNIIDVLNRNFDLKISRYVTIDDNAFIDIIDLLEGLEVTLSQSEVNAMNALLDEKIEHVNVGKQQLNGIQSAVYAHIYKTIGGDYGRTERQRIIVRMVFEKFQGFDSSTLHEMTNTIFKMVETDLSKKEMLEITEQFTQCNISDETGFPFDKASGQVQEIGFVVMPIDMIQNVKELHEFLYRGEDYEVSDTVKIIAENLEEVWGNRNATDD